MFPGSCDPISICCVHWEVTHVNVVQTLALEHGQLTDLMQQQYVACAVLATARNQSNIITAWCNVVVLFNLAVKKELIENLLTMFPFSMLVVLTSVLYLASALMFVFLKIRALTLLLTLTQPQETTFIHLASLNFRLKDREHQMPPFPYLSIFSSFHFFHPCITMLWYLRS